VKKKRSLISFFIFIFWSIYDPRFFFFFIMSPLSLLDFITIYRQCNILSYAFNCIVPNQLNEKKIIKDFKMNVLIFECIKSKILNSFKKKIENDKKYIYIWIF